MTLAVFGAGELGGRILEIHGNTPIAVTATVSRHSALRSMGARPTVEWPDLQPEDRAILAIPGSAAQLEAVQRLATRPPPKRVVLVSTIGFHRPYAGTLTPDSPAGTSPRARAAAATESAFREWTGEHGVIVRLAGLWHATRGPHAAFARKGTAPKGPPDAPLALIHYDDAARLVHRALTAATPPPVLLGVTSSPTREAFYTAASAAFDHPVPDFAAPIGTAIRFEDPVAHRLLGDPAFPDWRIAFRRE